jgi:ribose 5-phosphate isomerase B
MGADHRGREVVDHLEQFLLNQGHQLHVTANPKAGSCDYPDVAYQVANRVATGQADSGILICGTGIGMSMAANKIKGIRAAVVHDEISADMSRRHNDANVLCLPADMLGMRIIERIVKVWLTTEFEGGRHARRVRKVEAIEQGLDPAQVDDSRAVVD